MKAKKSKNEERKKNAAAMKRRRLEDEVYRDHERGRQAEAPSMHCKCEKTDRTKHSGTLKDRGMPRLLEGYIELIGNSELDSGVSMMNIGRLEDRQMLRQPDGFMVICNIGTQKDRDAKTRD
jgi:hypothetical protein